MHPTDVRPSAYALAALEALVRHGTYERAGEVLHLSPRTVRWHVGQVKQLLGAGNLYEVVARAALRGWINVTETEVALAASVQEHGGQAALEAVVPAAGLGDYSIGPLTTYPDVRPFDDTRLRSLLRDVAQSRCLTYGYSA